MFHKITQESEESWIQGQGLLPQQCTLEGQYEDKRVSLQDVWRLLTAHEIAEQRRKVPVSLILPFFDDKAMIGECFQLLPMCVLVLGERQSNQDVALFRREVPPVVVEMRFDLAANCLGQDAQVLVFQRHPLHALKLQGRVGHHLQEERMPSAQLQDTIEGFWGEGGLCSRQIALHQSSAF